MPPAWLLAATMVLGLDGSAVCWEENSATSVTPGVPGPEGHDAEPADVAARYLVLPLENQTKSAGLSWMSTALSATLAEKLEVHPALRAAYEARILSGLPVLGSKMAEAEQVLARARAGGAGWVFAGEFNRLNWKYQVGLRLYRVEADGLVEVARSETRAPEGAAGSGAVLELLDQAMVALLEQGGMGVSAAVEVALRRRPTRDVYALTLYGRALLDYDRLGGPGGLALPGRGALEKVEHTLQRVCYIDPKFAEAHRMLGLVYMDLGEPGKAMTQYAQALDLRPSYFSALLGLGQLYRREGSRSRAQEMMEKALALRPWDTGARLALGELLWEGQDLVRAQAELLRVVAERPEQIAARRALAQVYAARGMNEELATELRQMQHLMPDDIELMMDLGAVYQRMARPKQAIEAYEDVLRRQPRHAETLRLLGDLHRQLGEPARAVPLYQKMLRLLPDDPRPYFLLGSAYSEAGEDEKAEQVFQNAQQFRRYLGECWGNLGVLALRRNDLTRAHWYLSRAVSRAGGRAKLHHDYGLVLDRMNQPELALAELRTAAELEPQDAENYLATGVILLRQSRHEEAQRAFEQVLTMIPDQPMARHNVDLLKGTGRHEGDEGEQNAE